MLTGRTLLNTSETLGTKPIFLATLYSTNPHKDYPWETSKGRRKFVWQEMGIFVSVLLFCESGYFTQCHVMTLKDARRYWKQHLRNGWVCKLKKTPKIRGHFVRKEAERIPTREAYARDAAGGT